MMAPSGGYKSWTLPGSLDHKDKKRWVEEQDWDDGLGIQVPTETELRKFVYAAGYKGEEVLTFENYCGEPTTIGDAAAQLMFTAGKPRSLAAVVAALEALAHERLNLRGVMTTTGNAAICLVFHGQSCEQYGLHSGSNSFGPRAGANPAVGRAVALFLQNVCKATPAVLDMATIGQPGKFTWCGAEDCNSTPHSWESQPYAAVTVLVTSGIAEIVCEMDHDAEALLAYIASVMASPLQVGASGPEVPRSCALILAPEHAQVLAAAGYDRHSIASKLGDQCVLHLDALPSSYQQWLLARGWTDPLRPLANNSNLLIFAMGGIGRKSAYLPPWSGGSLHNTVALEARSCDIGEGSKRSARR